MKRVIFVTIFILIIIVGGHGLAQMIQKSSKANEAGKKITLESLRIPRTDMKVNSVTGDEVKRIPASSVIVDPESEAQFYINFACRGPYGRIYRPGDAGYEDCLNNEGVFSKPGPFSGKAVGGGFIVR